MKLMRRVHGHLPFARSFACATLASFERSAALISLFACSLTGSRAYGKIHILGPISFHTVSTHHESQSESVSSSISPTQLQVATLFIAAGCWCGLRIRRQRRGEGVNVEGGFNTGGGANAGQTIDTWTTPVQPTVPPASQGMAAQ